MSDLLYNAWGPGGLTNTKGQTKVQNVSRLLVGYDRWYPAIQNVEGRAIASVADDPDTKVDDNFGKWTVPVLFFGSTGMGADFLMNGIYSAAKSGSKDVTLNVLERYGHLDIVVGEKARAGRVRADPGLDHGKGTLMAAKAPEIVGHLSGEEIVALCRKHTIFEWSAQPKVDPIPVARAEGVYFWTPEGKRFLDFNSQLMCVNIGHGDRAGDRAIQEQAATLAYANPFMATEAARAAGREAGRDHARRHRRLLLHQRRRRGERERDQARARRHRPPQDPRALSLVPRRHGRRHLTLTGDPRRWAAEPGIPGVVRVPDFYHWGQASPEPVDAGRCATLEEVIQLEGAHTIAALIVETVVGHQRHPHPARRLHAGPARALRPSTASCSSPTK